MNKRETAEKVLDLLGGKENVLTFEHCATRLRIILKDKEYFEKNKREIEEIEGVKGLFFQTGQAQIIFGTGLVNKIYAEFQEIMGEVKQDTSVKDEAYKNMNPFQKAARIFGDIFIPILPLLVATGLFMGVRGLIMSLGIEINPVALTLSQVLTDTTFIFLPALITMNAAKKFGGNQYIGLGLGLMMVAPMLPNAWAVASGDAAPLVANIFGLNLNIIGFQGSVLPALIVGILIAKVEKKVREIVPNFLDLIVSPFIIFLVGIILALLVVGPIMSWVEHGLLNLFSSLIHMPFGIGGFIVGTSWPLIVTTGLHHAFNGLEATLLATTGMNPWNALITVPTATQGAAAIAVALKCRKKSAKTSYLSSAAPAFFGIVEPALFGVNMPRIKPFVIGCLASGLAAAIASVIGLAATGMAITVIPGALLYLNGQILAYTLVHLFGMAIAFIVTYLLWDEERYLKNS